MTRLTIRTPRLTASRVSTRFFCYPVFRWKGRSHRGTNGRQIRIFPGTSSALPTTDIGRWRGWARSRRGLSCPSCAPICPRCIAIRLPAWDRGRVPLGGGRRNGHCRSTRSARQCIALLSDHDLRAEFTGPDRRHQAGDGRRRCTVRPLQSLRQPSCEPSLNFKIPVPVRGAPKPNKCITLRRDPGPAIR